MVSESQNICRICGSDKYSPLGQILSAPLISNTAYDSLSEARAVATGTVEMVVCKKCGYAWNRCYLAGEECFSVGYENDQNHSKLFRQHISEAAKFVSDKLPKKGPISILEIGCGQGVFLREIVLLLGGRVKTVEAFDPAWRGVYPVDHPHQIIHKQYVDEKTIAKIKYPPNLIIARHCLDYFFDPIEILASLRDASQDETFIFIEAQSIDYSLSHFAVEDFCYERQGFFGETSLALLMQQAGWVISEQKFVFEGQYLWAFGRGALPSDVGDYHEILSTTDLRLEDFSNHTRDWTRKLNDAAKKGAVAIWGTGSKGIMFAVAYDPHGTLLECGIDINPQRQGKYLPVSGLQVVSPEQASERELKTIFVMNPAYFDEIKVCTESLGIKADLLPVVNTLFV